MSIAGTWQNEYDSIMTLTVDGNAISGRYQSSTGSVGTYEVVGFQLGAGPSEQLGQPVALAIAWHSIDDAPSDPSWSWASGLSGQINIRDGKEVLVLAHVLNASSEFPGLAAAGNYIDKLTYRRAKHAVTGSPSLAGSHGGAQVRAAPDPLAGRWIAEDGTTMTLEVRPEAGHRFGRVSGTITGETGETALSGFTDINATGNGLALQSATLTASVESGSLVASMSGTLELSAGILNLLDMRSAATAPGNSFIQTRISPARFRRQ